MICQLGSWRDLQLSLHDLKKQVFSFRSQTLCVPSYYYIITKILSKNYMSGWQFFQRKNLRDHNAKHSFAFHAIRTQKVGLQFMTIARLSNHESRRLSNHLHLLHLDQPHLTKFYLFPRKIMQPFQDLCDSR